MHLPANKFKKALASGSTQYGLWAGFGTGYAAEIIATTGFDWLLLDGEHAPNTVTSILAQLQAVAPYPVASMVRTVNHDASLIKQLLDVGTQTLMIPMVETAEQASTLVSAMRYPPHGIRGVGGGLTRATRWDSIDNYMATAHQELCLVVQVESTRGIDNVEAIAAVDGVDAVFVGPADLSASAGHVGNPCHPDMQAMIRRALEATHAAGKFAGILAPVEVDAHRYAEWGFDFIAVGIDISLLRKSAIETLAQYKSDVPAMPTSRIY